MSVRKTGRVVVKVNGSTYKSLPGAAMQPGGVRRTHEMTSDGKSVYTESDFPGEVRATFPHVNGLGLIDLQNVAEGTVEYVCDTGEVYVLPSASYAEAGDLENGNVQITWRGDPMVLS